MISWRHVTQWVRMKLQMLVCTSPYCLKLYGGCHTGCIAVRSEREAAK